LNENEGSIPFARSIHFQLLAQLCRKSVGKSSLSRTQLGFPTKVSLIQKDRESNPFEVLRIASLKLPEDRL
jgi:hypothetical protein